MTMPKLTPTLQRFYNLMADGNRHRLDEFRAAIGDDLASENTIAVQITALRKILRLQAEDIVCERENRAKTYRRVRTLLSGGE